MLATSLRSSVRLEKSKTAFPSYLTAFLFFLLPSFLQRFLRPNEFKPRRITSTSWLDGLRGVAAFFVYINHYTGRNFTPFQHSFGDHELKPWSSPLQLPFVRVVFCGLPMVHIFFVISGIALSFKPMKLVRARQYKELHDALSSSIFRRAFRLFLPTIGSTFFIMWTRYFGLIGNQLPTLGAQVWEWVQALWTILDIWKWDVLWFPPYDVHLWTIAIEFSHSMLLFLTVMGTSRMTATLRIGSLLLFIFYCVKAGHWGPAEFISGMVITEFTLIQAEKKAAIEALPSPKSRPMTAKRFGLVIVLSLNVMFALFVAGWPNGKIENLPGFASLYRNTPEPYWSTGGNTLIFPWYALGAVQIVMAVHQIPTLQKIFITPFAQYLGDISFSLYLMHGPLQMILEPRGLPYAWMLVHGTQQAGMWQYTIAWLIGLLMLGPPTIWISDIFWRLVDVQSVRFARWFEKLCVSQEPVRTVDPESTAMLPIRS